MIAESVIGVCSICSGSEFNFYTSGYDYEMETCSNKWIFKKCTRCAHVQLDPRPAPSTLNTIYPKHYYSYGITKKLNPIALFGKNILDRFKINRILNILNIQLGNYLDIGCGDGRYLRSVQLIANLSRSNIYGLELNPEVVNELCDEGFGVFCEKVETCNEILNNSISLATMFHVIEHVDNPVAVVKKISGWLVPGGVLAIETPNLDSMDAKLFKDKYWGGYHFPRHWHLFDEKTLSNLLRREGIEPILISYQTGHSFWMYSFHHLIKYKLRYPKISKIFDPLQALLPLIFFTGFDKIRSLIGIKTSSILIVGRKTQSQNVS